MSQAAKSVDGVTECRADAKKGTAAVTYAPAKTTPQIIAKVIAEKTGFKVSLPAEKKAPER